MAILDRLNTFFRNTAVPASGQIGDKINLGTLGEAAVDQIVEFTIDEAFSGGTPATAFAVNLEDCDTESGTYRKLQEIIPANLTGISDTQANLMTAFPAGTKLRVLVPARHRQFLRIAITYTGTGPTAGKVSGYLKSFARNM